MGTRVCLDLRRTRDPPSAHDDPAINSLTPLPSGYCPHMHTLFFNNHDRGRSPTVGAGGLPDSNGIRHLGANFPPVLRALLLLLLFLLLFLILLPIARIWTHRNYRHREFDYRCLHHCLVAARAHPEIDRSALRAHKGLVPRPRSGRPCSKARTQGRSQGGTRALAACAVVARFRPGRTHAEPEGGSGRSRVWTRARARARAREAARTARASLGGATRGGFRRRRKLAARGSRLGGVRGRPPRRPRAASDAGSRGGGPAARPRARRALLLAARRVGRRRARRGRGERAAYRGAIGF
jgi:hypothetical protein